LFDYFFYLFVCYQTREHNILKANEPILMPIDTSVPQGKGMRRSTFGVKRSKVEVRFGGLVGRAGF